MRVLGRRGFKRQDHRSLDDKEKKTKGKCHPLSWKEDQKPSFKIFQFSFINDPIFFSTQP